MWGWIAALVAGGLVVSHFSASALTDDQKVQMAVQAALAHETDPAVLTTFAAKLRAAGYDKEAASITAKLNTTHNIAILPHNAVALASIIRRA